MAQRDESKRKKQLSITLLGCVYLGVLVYLSSYIA